MAGKTAAIRRTAVREAGVSRHHGGPIGDTPETTRTSRYYRREGFKEGVLNWAPIMPRGVSASDSRFEFFPAGNHVRDHRLIYIYYIFIYI